MNERIGVVVNQGKRLDGPPEALREALAHRGLADVAWCEADKSRHVPEPLRAMLAAGIDRLLVWGGDGTVRRALDTVLAAGATDVVLGVMPAGTGNVLAANLGVPEKLEQALDIALGPRLARIDVGRARVGDAAERNAGEHFAVVAGAGFDGRMIAAADDGLKDDRGRAGYLWAGVSNTTMDAAPVTVTVDGTPWFDGDATCVLAANVATILGGLHAFPEATFADGRLHVAAVSASSPLQWAGALARTVAGDPDDSRRVQRTTGRHVDIRFGRPMPWEIDGGDRDDIEHLVLEIVPDAIAVAHGAGARVSG